MPRKASTSSNSAPPAKRARTTSGDDGAVLSKKEMLQKIPKPTMQAFLTHLPSLLEMSKQLCDAQRAASEAQAELLRLQLQASTGPAMDTPLTASHAFGDAFQQDSLMLDQSANAYSHLPSHAGILPDASNGLPLYAPHVNADVIVPPLGFQSAISVNNNLKATGSSDCNLETTLDNNLEATGSSDNNLETTLDNNLEATGLVSASGIAYADMLDGTTFARADHYGVGGLE
ncbi:uncharacterized protein LAESUDRAFT_760599 [Laetiporus sulphureus 93-53]|uniref:Uncharacterized protein n=1 Tax=Laetiporus sulphureus 93-53 TaxID=1314785 RepID=A0A165DLN4_9APHY|nr:uncharacterized protein LAESUDRAFT_760599 [Laetiporus sulphureus 93-53]KZT05156.1 hypothetical protein LAESUDRAFT_760599 [Laetiporus sulphureus 93-53]